MIVDFSFNVDLQTPAGYQEIVKFDASANDNEQKAEGAENKGYAGSTSQIITSTISIPLKYICLTVLVIQTSLNVLMLRYTRTSRDPTEPVYIASTAVLLAEILKIFICILILLKEVGYSFDQFRTKIHREAIENWKDALKLMVPALLYVVQNNLLYLALSNLDAATYQVTYQLKILTTAVFSVFMLHRKLNPMKWFSLVVLMVGVILVQWPDPSSAAAKTTKDVGSSSRFIGVVAVLCACVSSGFSGVYFEKILKGSAVSLWMRNLQLAFFSIIIATAGLFINDIKYVLTGGFFQGYNKLVFVVIFIQGVGGLIIGAVVKYADNILKGFATSISIVVSSVISYFLLHDFNPTLFFIFGSSAVLLATYIYSLPAKPTSEKVNPGNK